MKIDELRIRNWLYVSDLTQEQLAQKAGTTRATISAVCNGKSCSYSTAEKIASAMGVSVYELAINGETTA